MKRSLTLKKNLILTKINNYIQCLCTDKFVLFVLCTPDITTSACEPDTTGGVPVTTGGVCGGWTMVNTGSAQ